MRVGAREYDNKYGDFGGYEPFNTKPAVCAFGYVAPATVVVKIGGNTWEGACYTSGGQ